MVNSATKAMQAYRDRKRASGTCIYGGCWLAAVAGSYCLRHETLRYSREGNLRDGRKAKGLCPTCGLPADSEYVRCASCRQVRRAWTQRRKVA